MPPLLHQDWRIAHTPYHALNQREREAYNARRQILSVMGDLLRQAVIRMERQRVEREQGLGISSMCVCHCECICVSTSVMCM